MACLKNLEDLTFARPTTLYHDVIHMIIALLQRFSWKKFAVLYEKGHAWVSVYKALQLEIHNITEMGITKSQIYKHKSDVDSFLNTLKWKARSEFFRQIINWVNVTQVFTIIKIIIKFMLSTLYCYHFI